MTLMDLSLPVLALLLLGIVLYNVRVEKRRARSADQTVQPVSMRDVRLHDVINVSGRDDDDLFDQHRPFEGLSRH
jgi:hypothetical protein